jgi:hypothetical protein
MISRPIRIVMWLLTVALFGYNFYLWGGVKQIPHVGSLLIHDAKEAPLLAAYLVIGEKIDGTIGQSEQARAYAERTFADVIARPELLEFSATNRMLGAQSGFGGFAYWFAPVMLVLSVIAHFLRQKKVKSLGSQ